MAIVKGINPGDFILKYSEVEQRRIWNPETREFEMQDIKIYYALELYSRRSRTNGMIFDHKWFIPFFKALNIRVNPGWRDYYTGVQNYVAVGVRRRPYHRKEDWDRIEINEVAARHYMRKLKNDSLVLHILNKESMYMSPEKLQELYSITDDTTPEEQIVWPAEPPLNHFPVYST